MYTTTPCNKVISYFFSSWPYLWTWTCVCVHVPVTNICSGYVGLHVAEQTSAGLRLVSVLCMVLHMGLHIRECMFGLCVCIRVCTLHMLRYFRISDVSLSSQIQSCTYIYTQTMEGPATSKSKNTNEQKDRFGKHIPNLSMAPVVLPFAFVPVSIDVCILHSTHILR